MALHCRSEFFFDFAAATSAISSIMWKTSTIAICALVFSGSLAMAQTYGQSPGWMPPAPGNPPGGAGGPAPVRDIGGATANANQTADGRTSSTSMLSYSNKAQSAEGLSSSNYGNGPGGQSGGSQGAYYGSQAQMQDGGSQGQIQYGAQASCGNNGAVAITVEYGHRYNCRGDR
jgi:hypothetical protein